MKMYENITPMIVWMYVVVYRYMMYTVFIHNTFRILSLYIIYLYTTTYVHTIIGVMSFVYTNIRTYIYMMYKDNIHHIRKTIYK